MNLIRAALFAVLAFMGTISLSAQQSWLPPAQAIIVIENELNQLHGQIDVPAASGLQPKSVILENYVRVGCPDCMLKSVKRRFLLLTAQRIKLGMETGQAVEEVRALFISESHGNPTFLSNIQLAYEYMAVIL